VIVDAASEYDLRGFLQAGADIVIYSGHKFLGGPTSGIVAGRRDLVRAAYLQNTGIGRGMKIGKESIFGAIAALEAWELRDHAAIRAQETMALELWQDALSGIPGVAAARVADPTGNPLERLQVDIDDAVLGVGAATVARVLSERDPAIIVRNHEVELGYFQLDPCNLLPGQAERVATALRDVLSSADAMTAAPGDLDIARNGSTQAYLEWGKV
jgi:L-seryl-tRNA(Ser) seleniumtransferase